MYRGTRHASSIMRHGLSATIHVVAVVTGNSVNANVIIINPPVAVFTPPRVRKKESNYEKNETIP